MSAYYSTLFNGINSNAMPYATDFGGYAGPEYLGSSRVFSGSRGSAGSGMPTEAHARLAALKMYAEKRDKADTKYTRTWMSAYQPTSALVACVNLLPNLTTGTAPLNQFNGSFLSPLYFDIMFIVGSNLKPSAVVVFRIFQYGSPDAPPGQNALLYNSAALQTLQPTAPQKLSYIKYVRAYSLSLNLFQSTLDFKLIKDKITDGQLSPMRADSTSGTPIGSMNLYAAIYSTVAASASLTLSGVFELGFLDTVILPTAPSWEPSGSRRRR